MKKEYKLLIIVFTLVTAVLAVLLMYSNQTEKEDNTLKIAASIFPLYDITQNITQDKAEVVQILPSSASPHTFEPTLKDKKKVSNADLVFIIGHELDNWTLELLDNTTKVVVVDQGLDLLKSNHEDEAGLSGTVDPHYWLSITNAKIIALTIYNEIINLDPENKDYYEANIEEYLLKLDKLYKDSAAKLADLNQKSIITFHEGFNYFVRDLGLEVVASIEPFAGKTPSLKYINEVEGILQSKHISVLFKEPQLPDSSLKPIKDKLNVEVYTLDPLGGIEGRLSYIELIEYNVNTVYRANAGSN